jgi:uroporphyrin-III C-methyltransferase
MADPSERAPRISPGTVYLVGAGPGDPGLLTVRALELIHNADVVLHDHLITREILAECNPGARLIDIGKVGHGPQTSQTAIEQQMISLARAGRSVVRLKGGDPLLFGRGAEEAIALRGADVPFEIVPGVSSALAAPAYAAIPLTMRGIASTVAIMSGHCARTGLPPTSVPSADTIVVLMGVANAVAVRDGLLASGRRGDTPAAVIEWGTCARQRVSVGTLATLPEIIAGEGRKAPAVIVIGDVVGMRAMMDWRSCQSLVLRHSS